MKGISNTWYLTYPRALGLLTVLCLVLACSPKEEPTLTPAENSPYTGTPEACIQGQPRIETGYGDYPDLHCDQIVAQVNAEPDLTHRGYRNQCRKLTKATRSPDSVARIQVNDCVPMRDGMNGSHASMLVCCQDLDKQPKPAIIAYEAKLECPENQLHALATDLHYPGAACDEAAQLAEASLSNSHYQRACATAAEAFNQTRQSVLDASVFTCRKEAGVYLDVALCCSATLPKGRKAHPLEVAADIWEVLRTDDLFALKLLLSREPTRVKQRGEKGGTPLHHAVSLSAANALLAKKPDLEARNDEGYTPLHIAVMANRYEVAERLLGIGAKVDPVSEYGDAPLSFAKNANMAALLLTHKADVNGSPSSRSGSPLHTAAFYGRVDVADLLLRHGADIHGIDANGETPLHRAAFGFSSTSIDVARLLIDRGADVNAKAKSKSQKTPLDMTDKPDLKAFLISAGGLSAK